MLNAHSICLTPTRKQRDSSAYFSSFFFQSHITRQRLTYLSYYVSTLWYKLKVLNFSVYVVLTDLNRNYRWIYFCFIITSVFHAAFNLIVPIIDTKPRGQVDNNLNFLLALEEAHGFKPRYQPSCLRSGRAVSVMCVWSRDHFPTGFLNEVVRSSLCHEL